MIEALAVEAMARGYNIVLGHAHGRVDEGIALTSVLETRHTDAIVMLGDMQDQPRLLDDLRNSTVPVVATWQGTSPLEFPTVDVDERAGIIAGLEHLLTLGHERIAFVSGRLPGDNWQRQDAFVEFMGARFGGVPDGYVQRVDNCLAGGETALRALLALTDPPTAVVTSTDLVAVGVLHAAYNLGRTVPDELSVVGFDDLLLAAHTVPALTTLRMPIAEIVRESVELAIGFARDADDVPRAEGHRLQADARRPPVDRAAGHGGRGDSTRQAGRLTRARRPSAGDLAGGWFDGRHGRTGIQTRIAPTARFAQVK